jgi:hypothetical protein
MQTKGVLGLVLAFGLAFALLSGSGIGAAVFGENPGDAQTTRTIDEVSNQSSVDKEDDGGLGTDVTGDNEPTLVGLGISSGRFLVGLVGAVVFLKSTLINLGFPAYFAVPIARIAQIIAFIALVQFARTGELK